MNRDWRGITFSLEDCDGDDEERTRNRRIVAKQLKETAVRTITNEDMEPGSITLMVRINISRNSGGIQGNLVVERIWSPIIPVQWEPEEQ